MFSDIDRPDMSLQVTNGNNLTVYFENMLTRLITRVEGDVYLGSGVPNVALGVNTDMYIDLNALTFYTKAAGVWGASTALDNNSNTIKLSFDTL